MTKNRDRHLDIDRSGGLEATGAREPRGDRGLDPVMFMAHRQRRRSASSFRQLNNCFLAIVLIIGGAVGAILLSLLVGSLFQ